MATSLVAPRVITIEREYGSGATEIARDVAARLGWTLWDQLLTDEIAKLAHCEGSSVQKREEKPDSLYYRLLKSFSMGSYEGSSSAPVETLDADSIFNFSKHVVERAAATGNCVIVGRGSQHFLRDRRDTLRIFLYAPREEKLRRLAAEGKSESAASRLVDTVDPERAVFIKRYFHAAWPNHPIYHAMLNTELGNEAVTSMIVHLLRIRSQNVAASA